MDIIAERFGFEGSGAIADLFGQLAAIPNKQSFIDNYMAEQELNSFCDLVIVTA